MVGAKEVWRAQRSEGPATILAIGTANPSNYIDQSTYTDYYFRVTNCENKTELKDKFRLLCESSMIKKRHFFLTEDILKQNPNICQFDAPSLNARQEIAVAEVPKLGKEAALEAIRSWGQMKSEITHLIFCTNSGVNMPGADYQLTKLLGLGPRVKRLLLYNQGWFAGGTTLRLAKDLAENNKGARVLVVCSEISAAYFHGPDELHDSLLAGMSLFGDGAVSLIVGSDPIPELEKPIYEIISTSQRTIPDSDCQLIGCLWESGLMVDFANDIYGLVPNSIEPILVELFKPLGISDWNSIFWVVHPGAVGILDQVEVKLGLEPDKLWASRQVLSECGNMSSATVLFVLDEMRKKSIKDGLETSGGGLEWGVLLGFGHGLTIEALVLSGLPSKHLQ